MQIILKSNDRDFHFNLTGDSATDIINLKQCCRMLEISYQGVSKRIQRGESVEKALLHFIRKGA